MGNFNRAPPWRRVWSAIGLAVVMVSVGGFLVSRAFPRPTDIQTGPGGFRQAVLADGSTVQVNTRSALQVRIGKDTRHLALTAGEAHFNVAADATWPFIVVAGDTVIRAVGTEFSVRIRKPGWVVVLVNQGVVAVSHVQPANGEQLVPARHSLTDQGGRMSTEALTRDEVAAREGWRNDVLHFDGEPLSEVVDEINRYNRQQLEIADAAIAGSRIGGNFRPRDLEKILGHFENVMGMRTRRVTEEGVEVVKIYGPER